MIAARAIAYILGDMAAVASVGASIAQRQVTRQAARNREKARKAAVVAQMCDYAFQNHTLALSPSFSHTAFYRFCVYCHFSLRLF